MGRAAVPPRRDRQVVRVVGILKLLAEGGRPTVYELAARFKTRRETIYRDLHALEAVGYPITGDESGRLSRSRLAPGARRPAAGAADTAAAQVRIPPFDHLQPVHQRATPAWRSSSARPPRPRRRLPAGPVTPPLLAAER